MYCPVVDAATGNTCRKFREAWTCRFWDTEICERTKRRTATDTHGHANCSTSPTV